MKWSSVDQWTSGFTDKYIIESQERLKWIFSLTLIFIQNPDTSVKHVSVQISLIYFIFEIKIRNLIEKLEIQAYSCLSKITKNLQMFFTEKISEA